MLENCCFCSEDCPGTCALLCLDGLRPPVSDTDLALQMMMLINAFGPCTQAPCPGDVNGDGMIGPDDLAEILEQVALREY